MSEVEQEIAKLLHTSGFWPDSFASMRALARWCYADAAKLCRYSQEHFDSGPELADKLEQRAKEISE